MSGHTPGPWETAHCFVFIAHRPSAPQGAYIAEVFGLGLIGESEREANARLIAAAPRMAQALLEISRLSPEDERYAGGLALDALREAGIA